MSNIIPQITVDEFLTFKSQNVDILLDVQEYIKKVGNTNKINKIYKNQTNKKTHYQNYQKKQGWKNKYSQNSDNRDYRNRSDVRYNEDDQIYIKFRSHLNKLTEKNINIISNEIRSVTITKKDHLEKLIYFIFSKAVKESRFTMIYAMFVANIINYKININAIDIVFRDLFYAKCKMMLNECLSYDVELEQQYLSNEDSEKGKVASATFNFKDEVINCINFLGELYNYGVLNDSIVKICLSSIDKALENNKVYCFDIMCNFIKTTSNKFNINCNQVINFYVNKLLSYTKNEATSTKEKFTIMDLIDHLNKKGVTSIKY